MQRLVIAAILSFPLWCVLGGIQYRLNVPENIIAVELVILFFLIFAMLPNKFGTWRRGKK